MLLNTNNVIIKDKKKFILLIFLLVASIFIILKKEIVFRQLSYQISEQSYRYKTVVPLTLNEKGYIIYIKDPLEDVNIEGLSSLDYLVLHSFGAKGQSVPHSFVIYATEEMAKIKITASDLKNEKNEVISANHIAVRVGMRQAQRKLLKSSPEDYVIVTRFLSEIETFSLSKGTFKEIYVLIQIPSQATPGTYKGEITINPENNKSTKILISLEVFPFALQKPPNKKYGMYYYLNDSLRLYDGKKSQSYITPEGKRRARLEIEQMKMYGAADIFVLDSGISYQKINDEIRIYYDEIEIAFSLLKKSGIKDAQIVIRTRFENLAKLLGHKIMEWEPGKELDGIGYENLSNDKNFYLLTKKALLGLKKLLKLYPEFSIILSHYSDEIDYPKGKLPLFIELTKAARQEPSYKIYVTFFLTYRPWKIERLEKLREKIDQYVDIRGHDGGLFEWWLIGGVKPEEYDEELKKSDDLAWVYYNPDTAYKNAHYYRIVNGLNMWQNNVFNAHVPWTYFYHRRGHTDIFKDLLDNDEKRGLIGFSFPSFKDGITPVPTRIFEGWREGIYDMQYFSMLEDQLKKCDSKNAKPLTLINDAKKWSFEIKNLFPKPEELSPDEKKWSLNESLHISPLTFSAMEKIPLKELNKIRYKTAKYILALMEGCK